MGNFSVNHYVRIMPQEGGANLSYVLDFAEIPTFELLQKWSLQGASPQKEIESRTAEEAREWVRNLKVTMGGKAVQTLLEGTRVTLADGVGGMKVMRVVMKVGVKGGPGELQYEDRNYPERTGWKEVVIGEGADRSQALTAYPTDPTVPQPQDLRAAVRISGREAAAAQTVPPAPVEPAATPAPVEEAAPTASSAPTPPQAETMGSLKRGDYLSRVLHGGEIGLGVGLISMLVAFGLGALHAFEPGHGKTMVAAYLVGSRGTAKHAALLGFMTTFTHTISVFALGFVTLFLSHYIMPEKMTRVLGVISGLSIVWIGGIMLYRRWRKLLVTQTPVHHHHEPGEGHSHSHSHSHPHDHEHRHDHDHSHEHAHHHMPEGEITTGSLMALGASGGLVPCPAALILLLTCISLGRPGFGILLLLSFSVGLAMVLMATGMVVLFAKNLVPERHRHSDSPLMQMMPVVSAAVIVVVGIVMTGVSLGWLPAVRFLG
jgi:ABC-type nickel/cobalt efflux system permease component RcnA